MISTAQIHPQLALLFCKDDFDRPDSSPACSFLLQLAASEHLGYIIIQIQIIPAKPCVLNELLFFTLALPSEIVPDQSGKITSAFRE